MFSKKNGFESTFFFLFDDVKTEIKRCLEANRFRIKSKLVPQNFPTIEMTPELLVGRFLHYNTGRLGMCTVSNMTNNTFIFYCVRKYNRTNSYRSCKITNVPLKITCV